MSIIRRHISCARAQQPSSGKRNGMQGEGTVSGSQLVAAIASNACRAFARDTQPNHRQRSHSRNHRISFVR
jgi:hypothetical protein